MSLTIIIIAAIAALVFLAVSWYRVVSASEAHLVITPTKKMVVSADPKVRKGTNNNTYFSIPSWVVGFGRTVRKMDVTIKELLIQQETYEVAQARYLVSSSTKYRIVDVETAAETFINNQELKEMLQEVVRAAVRTVTVKYDVVDARSKKKEISDAIEIEMRDDLAAWGLKLVSFQLVNFEDTQESAVISDISKRREVEIASRTREENAERKKQARVTEADAEREAREKEIETEKVVGQKQQDKLAAISIQEKLAKEQEYEVRKVEIVKQAEIDKSKAIVKAEEDRETEKIHKEQKQLEGEGDRLRDEERAKGEAAPIREKGLAEAQAKDKLQEALNKFKDEAIRALIAEKLVQKDLEIGVATANALMSADLKVFAGGGDGKAGFDLGQLISGAKLADSESAESLLNRIARPSDLGINVPK